MTQREAGQFMLFILIGSGLIYAITKIRVVPEVEVVEEPRPGMFEYDFTIVQGS